MLSRVYRGIAGGGRALMAIGAVVACMMAAPALAAGPQTPVRRAAVRRAVRQAAKRQRAARPVAPEVQQARAVLVQFLRQGPRQPYVGEQTTQILAGGLQSTEIVKHQGPGHERIEFLTPERMKGEVILHAGGRFLHYKRRPKPVILEGIAAPELFEGQARELIQGIRSGRIQVRLVGNQVVADQPTAVIEMHTSEGGWRLYIDQHTGVRLKSEKLGANGAALQSSFFTRIDYTPTFAANDFRPDSLPRVPHEGAAPPGPPLPSVQAAQQQVTYTIREPSLPVGFRLIGVWVLQRPAERKTTILRYTDGANTFTLVEQPARPNQIKAAAAAAAAADAARRPRRALRHWVAGGLSFSLIGSLRAATVEQIVQSLQ